MPQTGAVTATDFQPETPTAGRVAATDFQPATPASSSATPAHTWIDKAADWLPTIGGMAGGIVGGIGGTVAGVGVGGVPGAIGGAAIGGAGGESLRQIIEAARGRPMPTTSAAAEQMGTEAAVQGGAEVVGQGLAKGAATLAPRLMQSAVKPGLKFLKGPAGADVPVVKTLLDEGITVSKAGVQKLQTLFDATNADIKAAVANAAGSIQPANVAQRASEVADKFMQQVNPATDLQAVKDSVQEFLTHPKYVQPTSMAARAAGAPAQMARDLTIPEAQALKQGTYKQLAGKYGELSAAATETQKALARGLKEEIAAAVPGIANLNAKDAQYMAALEAVGHRVALSGNANPIGLAFVAHHPMTFLAAVMDRSPAAKSLLARGLYLPAGQAAKISPQLLKVATGMIASQSDDQP